MHTTFCYGLMSLEQTHKHQKENNHYVINIKRSSLLHDAFKTVKYQYVFCMFIEEHKDNNQPSVVNKIQNNTHMHN